MMQLQLSSKDGYILRRVLSGMPIEGLRPSGGVALLLNAFNPQTPDGRTQLISLLDQAEVTAQVLAHDPAAPPPDLLGKLQPDTVPELPAQLRLTAKELKVAKTVGKFLDDYMAWAAVTANETPLTFLEFSGIWCGSAAIGRRLYVPSTWGKDIFPNLFGIVIAISTYYRKSAGLRLAEKIIQGAIPHMLMPNPGSPENFQTMLAGEIPSNFETMRPDRKERWRKGRPFAAQRVLLRDEISALFKSMGRDYMAGLKELIMDLYECPDEKLHSTQSRGEILIQHAALSIHGATTPSELALSINPADWSNGNLARFALLSPEPNYRKRARPKSPVDFSPLVTRLKRLHELLPMPPTEDLFGTVQGQHEEWAMFVPEEVWERILAYEDTLREMCHETSSLDNRLRAVYGRLHVQLVKVAIVLAAFDWADNPNREERPSLTMPYFLRALEITERWRTSAHRAVHQMGASEESELEKSILRLLKSFPDGLSGRDIYRYLDKPRKRVMEVLEGIVSDGIVDRVQSENPGRGRTTQLYKVIE